MERRRSSLPSSSRSLHVTAGVCPARAAARSATRRGSVVRFPFNCATRRFAPVTYVGPACCGELLNQETACRRGGMACLGESEWAPSPAPRAL